MFAPPAGVGTELVQGTLPETEADEAAVVFGTCVEALGPSPGNCVARCGLTDAEALWPTVVPDVVSLFTESGCGMGKVVRTVEVGTLNGFDPQPTAAVPAGELADAHGVWPRPAPRPGPGTGRFATVEPAAGAALLGTDVLAGVPLKVVAPFVVVLSGVEVTVGPFWAWAALKAATHRTSAGANKRCIASSFSHDFE
jgi:hypothetical protein